MNRASHNAVDKASLLVPIGKLKIVQEAAIRGKCTDLVQSPSNLPTSRHSNQ